MNQIAKQLYDGALNASLWIVGLGLMLASSGVDGAYMAQWMPDGWDWLGYALNTTADVCGVVLMYWFGRIRQFPKNTKRYRLGLALLPAEVVAVAYSWFFSWLRLRPIFYRIEQDPPFGAAFAPLYAEAFVECAAFVSAGFIPLLLAFVGYAQALLAGRIEATHPVQSTTQESQESAQESQEVAEAPQPAPQSGNGASHTCPYCGAAANASGQPFASTQAVSAHLRFCDAYQAQRAAHKRKAAEVIDERQ